MQVQVDIVGSGCRYKQSLQVGDVGTSACEKDATIDSRVEDCRMYIEHCFQKQLQTVAAAKTETALVLPL